MNDSTLIADLVRSGLDPELVGRVANALAAASGGNRVDAAAEKRRAWDREYRRNRQKDRVESGGNRVDDESALSSTSSPQSKNSKEGKKERGRGEKLPPDWQPNARHVATGAELGYTHDGVLEQAEDLRLWARSNEHRAIARKSDWDLTFMTWLRRNKPKDRPDDKSILGALNKIQSGFSRESSPHDFLRLSKG